MDKPLHEPTVYELSQSTRNGVTLPQCDVSEFDLPELMLRSDNGLPELTQLDVVRHYLHLAQHNFGVDSGFYPLGSCTMKYNPKLCEAISREAGYTETHPLQSAADVQSNLKIMHELQNWLAAIGGFKAVSLQPAAGAHGELSALLMIRAYHQARNDHKRVQVLIPDSAHGTNPASSSMAGLHVLQIPSNDRGTVDLGALRAACDETVACIMITNPNTLGLFEDQIEELAALVHGCGGLVYGDGANMNALMGIMQPGNNGVDLMHFNLHKTFSTPHGGGGPGAGPLAAGDRLAAYLPGPVVKIADQDTNIEPGLESSSSKRGEVHYELFMPAKSIGRVGAFQGNFGMILRALTYLRLLGDEGIKASAQHAVLNANYLRVRLSNKYKVPYDRLNMHEFVCQGQFAQSNIRAHDICKRLLDFAMHPPTSYFPLIVKEALMIEPTETESKQTLDAFVDAMMQIAEEAIQYPDLLKTAPHHGPVKRLDETHAARHLILREHFASCDSRDHCD